MDILVILAYIELVIVVLALISNSLFTFMISKASSLHYNCRGLLLLFSFSMYLLTTSHGLTVIEFLYEGKSYEYLYFVSVRVFYWRTVHEFGYSLQSLSLLLFAIERLVASNCPTAYQSVTIKILFILLSLISVAFSLAFTLFIHLRNEMFWPTVPMNVIDVLTSLILLIAWKRSFHRYRTTVGVFSLEERFQLSEVYTWSRDLIPVVLLASLCKFTIIIIIWILITSDFQGNESAFLLIIYNNILNVYTVVLPFLIMIKHRKMREKMIRHRKPAAHAPKTIDGRVIPSKHDDFFEHLRADWQ